jgi:ribosomal protein S18 acetylase RimI-like enzyme
MNPIVSGMPVSGLDGRIQQSVVDNLAGRPRPVDSGPFLIGFDPSTDSPGVNYATPRPGRVITAADITALVEAFTAIERKPRLEYVVSTAPALEALLLGAGFAVEERHTYLVCSPDTFVAAPVPAGYVVRSAATDGERAEAGRAAHEAFTGQPAPPATAEDLARTVRNQQRGGKVVVALSASGECAGGGQAVPPNSGVSEVVGIAVRERFRRQGLAAAVTAEVSRELFADGVEIAWLEASGPDAARIYGRAGYRPAGKRLYIAR